MVGLIGDHISDSIRANGTYERHFLAFLEDELLDLSTCRAKVAVDVGANIGNHTLVLSEIFARVIAFEPNPLARWLLQINLELNCARNVEVRSVGLSDRAGKATLAFDHGNLGGASVLDIRSGSGGHSEVELVVGDQAIDCSEPIGFIKVDVEGLEESVLRGLRATIQAHRPIIMIEQWNDVIDAATGGSQSFKLLRDLGYFAWELQAAPAYRGPVGKIASLLLGRTDYVLQQVERLEKRDYYALFFMPEENSALSRLS